MPARHLGKEVGGRGRHHDEVSLAREPDVTDIELGRRIEQVREHPLGRERAGRQRCDELLRRAGENATYGKPVLLQSPDEIERFVGRNAAANDQENASRARGRNAI